MLAQVQKFEARKAQLTQRVTLIEQLRRGQSAPVHVLDEISKSLPDRLWLTEMQADGQRLHASAGSRRRCRRSRISSPNLEATKWFKRPVEILDSQVQTDPKAGDLVRFSIKGALNDPEAPPPVPVATGRRSAAGARSSDDRAWLAR